MAEKNVQNVQEANGAAANEADVIINKAKGFWAKFSKPIIYIGGAIILLGGGWLAYKNFVKVPAQEKAEAAFFPAEQMFDKMVASGNYNKDTVNIILNGGTNATGAKVTGLLKIISGQSGTPAANKAHYLAGALYLHTKEFDKAISQLKAFDGNGAHQLQSVAYGMIGDAYAELKKNDDALSYYKKAASENPDDEFITPDALMKAGMFSETIGKTKDAMEMYQKIKDRYPNSSQGKMIDKYLARLGVTN